MLRLAAALALLATLAVGASLARAAPTNNIFTAAGTGTAGFNGDGVAATAAQLSVPVAVAATADGGYLITDQGNNRVRKVSPNGLITTVAGTGASTFGGDGGPATAAQLSVPNGLAITADGSILIADSNNHRVRRVSPAGTITTVAGTSAFGYNGDGIPATSAQLNFPSGLAVTPDGGFLIADNDNNRIRKVSPGGTITTVAGVTGATSGGDGGPATSAGLNDPADVAVTANGGYLIAELNSQLVRRVSAGGTITTVAGTGTAGSGGDGGPATAAQLNSPGNVAVTADGGYLISDRSNNRVRKVSPDGTIATVAGTGVAGSGGDGGPATGAQLNLPTGLAVTAEGDYLIADALNHRVRVVDAGEIPPPATKLAKPVLGRTVNVRVVRGQVRVAVPARKAGGGSARSSQKGLRFVPLTAARQIRVGSFLDTRKGTVGLTSARDTRGRTQSGNFASGVFQVLQSRKRSAKGLTSLVLKRGTSVRKCRATRGKRALTALSRRALRRLRGNAKGRFRTRGRYSAATVRGTKWTVTDRCDGTLTKVTRGKVAVRDFRRKKTILLRAGKSYLARSRR